MKPEQERVKTVLIDTVALLCKNGLSYEHELKIQAVIGVTVDENDVFIVHINETFNPHGASSTSAAGEMSMAVVPFSPHGQQTKREFDAARTPSSGVKRMKAESMSAMSPSSDFARQHAKQQLRFASPAKSAATGLPAQPPRARGAAHTVRGVGGMTLSAPRGAMRAPRRGAVGRGILAGRSQRGLGIARMSTRPAARGSVRGRGQRMPSFPAGHRLPAEKPADLQSHYDMKFTSGNMSTAAEVTSSRMTPSSAAADSSVGFNFNAYHSPATLPFNAPAGDGHHNVVSSGNGGADLPTFSTGEQNRFVNTVPPGFGFDGIFASDSSGIQTGSFADINPSVEFGFQPNFSSSDGGVDFARSASSVHNVNVSDIKTESSDDDVIFVEDDAAAAAGSGTSAAAAGEVMFEGSPDVGEGGDGLPGAAVQQITRRVTITTNIQGQNVKYEQVQHAVAPVVPSNSASFQSCINSTTSSSPSQFAPNMSDPSLLNNPVYEQPVPPVYEYSNFPHSSMAADIKPGWDVLSGMPGATATSPPHQQPSPRPRQMTTRGAKTMMNPRSNVSSSHVHPLQTPMSQSSSYNSSLDSVRGVHPSAQRGGRGMAASAKKPSVGGMGLSDVGVGGGRVEAKKPSVGGMGLSDVGVGGGRVEDGTAWSMVARFVCSVPGCGASFTRKQNLQRHQTQKHGRPKSHARLSSDNYNDIDDDDDDDSSGAGSVPAFY